MTPVAFPEANAKFGAPPDLEESQCMTIKAYAGRIHGGSLDGENVVVTAWMPSPEEREMIAQGRPIFLSFIGGLPPHYPSLDFNTATHPA